jgi:prepilin-type N-terminal cleavage/methylation domain-containing protein/prepilin-type processing-associated H-X9-DG protein
MKQQRRGFSILELLIVIAIIAILSAILLPVFEQAKNKARYLSCFANHKQLGSAVMMYTQDYDGKFPMTANFSATPKTLWTQSLFPYLKNKGVFRCTQAKTDTFLKQSSPTSLYADSWENRNHASIGMNAQFSFDKAGKLGFKKAAEMRFIDSPAIFVMLADTVHVPMYPSDRSKTNNYRGGYTFDVCPTASKVSIPPIIPSGETRRGNIPSYAVSLRHQRSCPITFADGHVKSLRMDDFDTRLNWQFRWCDFDEKKYRGQVKQ